MKIFLVVLSMFVTALISANAVALNLFACEPEWGALAQELGGDRLSIYVATNAMQDPHQVQAKPSLLAQARRANLIICTGAQLEIGWLPVVLRQSGNAAIQPNKPGYFEAAEHVQRLGVPILLDRSAGDIHQGGNPHIQTDPRNIANVATALAQRLAEIDPVNAEFYQARYRDFAARWAAAIARWEQQAAPLRGVVVVAHHSYFVYLDNWLGLKTVAQLEPKPGVQPTSTHLAEIVAQLQRQPAKMVLRAPYNSERPSEWLSERARIPAIMLPGTVGGSDQAKDLFGLFDDTVQRLLAALK